MSVRPANQPSAIITPDVYTAMAAYWRSAAGARKHPATPIPLTPGRHYVVIHALLTGSQLTTEELIATGQTLVATRPCLEIAPGVAGMERVFGQWIGALDVDGRSSELACNVSPSPKLAIEPYATGAANQPRSGVVDLTPDRYHSVVVVESTELLTDADWDACEAALKAAVSKYEAFTRIGYVTAMEADATLSITIHPRP